MPDTGRNPQTFLQGSAMRITGLALFIALVFGVSGLQAHVTVQPKEVPAKGSQEFAVRVPTEKDAPTTAVKIVFPEGFELLRVKPAMGWTYEIERDASGKAMSITWSGGRIARTEYEVFTFMARAANPGTFKLDAYQTYGTDDVVAWVNPAEPRPAPQVRVVAPVDAEAPAVDPFSASGAVPAAGPATEGGPVIGRAGVLLGGLSFVISLAALAISTRAQRPSKG